MTSANLPQLSVMDWLELDGSSPQVKYCSECGSIKPPGLKDQHSHLTLTSVAADSGEYKPSGTWGEQIVTIPANDEKSELEELKESFEAMSKLVREYIDSEKGFGTNCTQSAAIPMHTAQVKQYRRELTVPMSTAMRKSLEIVQSRAPKPKPPGQGVKHATEWLKANYEMKEGISVPRRLVYSQYLESCRANGSFPTNQAHFGKLLRSLFEKVRTRRLGNRGKSKYHYYGLQVKSTSKYRDSVTESQRINVMYAYSKTGQQCRTMSQCDYTPPANFSENGILIPNFPTFDKIKLNEPSVSSFLASYHQHCIEVADVIVRTDFFRVRQLFQQFWFNVPKEKWPLFERVDVINLITLCDMVLFRAISGVLIPDVLIPVQTTLLNALRQFIRSLPIWVEVSTSQISARLTESRKAIASRVCKHMYRNTEIVHFASAARESLARARMSHRLLADWISADPSSLALSCGEYFVPLFSQSSQQSYKNSLDKYLGELVILLQHQATIEQFGSWCKQIIRNTQLDNWQDVTNIHEYRRKSSELELIWNYLSNAVCRYLAAANAEATGTFHLLHLFMRDHMTQLVDKNLMDLEERLLQRSVYKNPDSMSIPPDNARLFANSKSDQ